MDGAFAGQGWLQLGQLLLAFGLSALVGLERQWRRHSAGLRTQAIVGTASALFVLVSKYGFLDVLGPHVQTDPARVAAQVVTGIGFLGAGLILTRHGAVRGLTTAASVWETAAIGMAAGAGLWLLAIAVTALHFVITFVFPLLTRRLPGGEDQVQLKVVYLDGRGLLREVLASATGGGWVIQRVDPRSDDGQTATVTLELEGRGDAQALVAALAAIDGVRSVQRYKENELE